jgi:hypothetical protein
MEQFVSNQESPMTGTDCDPAKQPPECKSVFVPFSEESPKTVWDGPNATGRWTQCPNLKTTYEGFDGERWRCEVCGKSYFLDYEDMR